MTARASNNDSAVGVAMPRLSDAMEEGTILSWLPAPGQRVEVGDELVEIETDKATMTWAAETAGWLEILVPEGEQIPVGEPICRLLAEPPADQPVEEPAPASSGDSKGQDGGQAEHEDGGGRSTWVEQHEARPRTKRPADSGRRRGRRPTPLARRIAEANGIDLATLTGSGPGGRVLRSDVQERLDRESSRQRAAGASRASPESRATIATPASAADGGTREGGWTADPTPGQRRIAERMLESQLTTPDFGLIADADMGAALELREGLRRGPGEGPRPSLNDIVIMVVAQALLEFPRANGSYRDDRFELHDRIGIGFAVATEDGLLVPTVADPDRKSLGEIARETKRLSRLTRSGRIQPAELGGGTFTVSNLGMYGMRAILPVINPGQAAILGVGAVEQRVVAVDGAPTVRPQLTLSLICDHRILYGAEASRFLLRIRLGLEQPLSVVL